MSIFSKASLEAAISDWLLRDDLGEVIPTFISSAENAFRRDARIRRLVVDDAFQISGAVVAVPPDFVELESITLENSRPLDTVGVEDLKLFPAGGRPCAVAIVDQKEFRFAPAPEEPITVRLEYWQTVPRLGAGVQTNWLLNDHSDIYLYGSLVESAPYLREDERVALWRSELERRMEELHANNARGRWGGTLVRRSRRPIP